ncbi:hypothetical protein AHAS_Ahas15G0312500 [Arachis hypogaea]
MVFLLNDIYSIFRILDINLGSDDPLSQGHTDQSSINKPAESMLSLVEESASEPTEENMMVVRVPIQVCLPLSQTAPVPEIEPTPAKSPSEKINKETTKSTPEPPPKTKESTPTLPPASSKVNPAPEDVAALMMMARTASYIPKEGSMPSFSLDLIGSSQEEAATAKTPETPKLIEQLGELVKKIVGSGVKIEGKTPAIHKQSGEQSFEKFETPARTNEMSAKMKEKCYIWATRVKTSADGRTNEYDAVCTLIAQDKYILSKLHFASLQADTHIEAENMAIANHPEGVFLQPKTNKPFRVEDYPMFISFLDLKKLASHRYGHVISRMRVYAGAPLKKDDHKIHTPYIDISGQKTSYDCAIYDEVDHFRVEYAFRILFHEMNQDKVEAIRESNAIRLSKPSSLLLSSYCQIDSNDIDTD